MSAAYSPDQWHDFAVGLASASGALAGLVFVAVSVSARSVFADRFHRRRSESTFVILLAVLAVSLVLLFPGMGRVAAGVASVIVGATLEVRAAGTWPIVWAERRREARWSWAVAVGANLMVLAGGVSLVVAAGGGLYVVAAGLVIVLVRALYDIWMLFAAATSSAPPESHRSPGAGSAPSRDE